MTDWPKGYSIIGYKLYKLKIGQLANLDGSDSCHESTIEIRPVNLAVFLWYPGQESNLQPYP